MFDGFLLWSVLKQIHKDVDFIMSLNDSKKSQKKWRAKIKRMRIYAGTSQTILSILGLLQVPDVSSIPPFAASMQIEVWKRKSLFYIRLLYQGQVVISPYCDLSWCSYSLFSSLVSTWIPQSILECQSKKLGEYKYS